MSHAIVIEGKRVMTDLCQQSGSLRAPRCIMSIIRGAQMSFPVFAHVAQLVRVDQIW